MITDIANRRAVLGVIMVAFGVVALLIVRSSSTPSSTLDVDKRTAGKGGPDAGAGMANIGTRAVASTSPDGLAGGEDRWIVPETESGTPVPYAGVVVLSAGLDSLELPFPPGGRVAVPTGWGDETQVGARSIGLLAEFQSLASLARAGVGGGDEANVIHLTLRPASAIRGHLVLLRGGPPSTSLSVSALSALEVAQLKRASSPDPLGPASLRRTIVEPTGRFAIEGLLSGQVYRIVVLSHDYAVVANESPSWIYGGEQNARVVVAPIVGYDIVLEDLSGRLLPEAVVDQVRVRRRSSHGLRPLETASSQSRLLALFDGAPAIAGGRLSHRFIRAKLVDDPLADVDVTVKSDAFRDIHVEAIPRRRTNSRFPMYRCPVEFDSESLGYLRLTFDGESRVAATCFADPLFSMQVSLKSSTQSAQRLWVGGSYSMSVPCLPGRYVGEASLGFGGAVLALNDGDEFEVRRGEVTEVRISDASDFGFIEIHMESAGGSDVSAGAFLISDGDIYNGGVATWSRACFFEGNRAIIGPLEQIGRAHV